MNFPSIHIEKDTTSLGGAETIDIDILNINDRQTLKTELEAIKERKELFIQNNPRDYIYLPEYEKYLLKELDILKKLSEMPNPDRLTIKNMAVYLLLERSNQQN